MNTLDPAAVARDPGIPALRRALDLREAARFLEPHLARTAALGDRVRLRAVRPVRHKPGRRCLIEYELDVEQRGMPSERVVVLGKTRSRGVDRFTVLLVERLWKAGFSAVSRDRISVPEPLGVVPELGVWLQRRIPGTTATSLLLGRNGPLIARRIAGALHKLHRSGPPARRAHGLEDELAILDRKLSSLARERPALSRRLGALRANSRSLAATIPAGRAVGIHRDFYSDQVLVGEDGRLYLLDLDLYSEGDPALDAGNFLAHVIEGGLREGSSPAAIAAIEESFRERWLALAGERKRRGLEVHTLLSIARHVALSAEFPDRRPWTEAILELTERRAASLRSCVSTRSFEVAS